MEIITNIVNSVDSFIWGLPMIVLLVITHLYLTYKTKFVQRKVFLGIKHSVAKEENGEGDVSTFGALTTALASTIGTGNILGVTTAVVAGGPGAVFWTWITGIFAIATKYAETYIACKTRKKTEDGDYIGGAMTALDKKNKHGLAVAFAVITCIAAFGIGCGVQSNAISSLLESNYNIPSYITGLVLAILTFIVIFGGIKSIANVCTRLVPIMSIVYTIGCIIILFINRSFLLQTLGIIVTSAFEKRAMIGGFAGSTIMIAARYGMARGLFSNEAGMGSAPMASAAAKQNNAVKQALVGSTGVFWDTIVVCLMTGLVLCSSIVGHAEITSVTATGAAIGNGELLSACFKLLPTFGLPLLIFGIITFAYSTILGWNYYATQSVRYLFGKKYVKAYLFIWVIVIFLGSILDLNLIWNIADILNALMVIPNVIAIFLYTKELKKDTEYYLYQNHLDEKDNEME